MENDLDVLLYEKYLNGKTEAFEILYNKYKDKLKYFIFNIVNDYQKAEDIMQEVFIYVLQNKLFQEHVDELRIPFISISDEINYDELCGRFIKGTEWWIRQALQTIDFELNNVGGSIKSEALIDATRQGGAMLGDKRTLIFNSDFILYLKEENKDKPYFALKVDDIDVLVEEKNE